MVLTSVAFVVGAGIASGRRPDLDYSNLLWEGMAITAWSVCQPRSSRNEQPTPWPVLARAG